MEPDLTNGAGAGAATATPTPATQTADLSTPSTAPATAGGEPQTVDPGRAVGDDFNHPVYGPKLKNFQKGLEEKAKRLNEIEEKHGKTQRQIDDLNARLATKPELLNQVRALYGLPPVPTATAEPENDDPIARTTKDFETFKAGHASDQAILMTKLELGNGDYTKGNALYESRAPKAFALMQKYDNGDAKTRLDVFMRLAAFEESATTRPQPPAAIINGHVPATEMGGGARPVAVADEGPMTPEKALRLAGYTPAQWAAEHGVFD